MGEAAYEIIVTLGPASSRPETWRQLLAAGATQFRLNTSHVTVEETGDWLDRLDAFLGGSDYPVVLDLQGSKWRLGTIAATSTESVASPRELSEGARVELILGDTAPDGPPGVVTLPVPHASFFEALGRSAGEIRMNDAKVILEAEDPAAGPPVSAIVRRGGSVSTGKGVAVPGSTYRRETLSEKDATIVDRGRVFSRVRFAVSYVRDAEEMQSYRRLLGAGIYLVAKLERRTAVAAARSIAGSCDELWICRGDLGAEVGPAEMARSVRRFTNDVLPQTGGGAAKAVAVPIILAGQVLEHMSEHAIATRSELCYLHDALQSGYEGVVLSDETAVGRWPVAACETAALFGSTSQDAGGRWR